jgi:hypothetical protein
MRYLPWAIAMPFVAVWGFQLDGIFIGATRARDLRDSMLISFLGYLALAVAARTLVRQPRPVVRVGLASWCCAHHARPSPAAHRKDLCRSSVNRRLTSTRKPAVLYPEAASSNRLASNRFFDIHTHQPGIRYL